MEEISHCPPKSTVPFLLSNRAPALQQDARFSKIKTILLRLPCHLAMALWEHSSQGDVLNNLSYNSFWPIKGRK